MRINTMSATDADLNAGQLIERLAQTVLYQRDDKVVGTIAFP